MLHANKNNTSVPIPVRAGVDGALAVGTITTAKASFTRPANTTAYAAGDVISNSASATTKMEFACGTLFGANIVSAMFKTNNPLFVGKVRLWLTNNSAYTVVADNAAQAMAYASSEIGYIDVTMSATGTACAVGGVSNFCIPFKPDALGKIYGWFETTVIQTPTSAQQFSAELTFRF